MNSTLLSDLNCTSTYRPKTLNPTFNPRPKFVKIFRRARVKATELTSEFDFERKVLQSKDPTVVIFSAPWCIHSVTMKPRMHRLANEFSGRASVYIVDADKNTWTRDYVQTYPMIVNYRSGREVCRSSGTVDYSVIKRNLESELRRR